MERPAWNMQNESSSSLDKSSFQHPEALLNIGGGASHQSF